MMKRGSGCSAAARRSPWHAVSNRAKSEFKRAQTVRKRTLGNGIYGMEDERV
jgi:hypothetical protein